MSSAGDKTSDQSDALTSADDCRASFESQYSEIPAYGDTLQGYIRGDIQYDYQLFRDGWRAAKAHKRESVDEYDAAGFKDLTLDKIKNMLGAHNDGVYKLQARWNIGTIVEWLVRQIEGHLDTERTLGKAIMRAAGFTVDAPKSNEIEDGAPK